MTVGETTAWTIWTFFGKVMSLLFNTLSRFVTVFLPRSKCLLVSWLQAPTTVILELKKINPITVSIVSPSICHEVKGLDVMIWVFGMVSFRPAFIFLIFSVQFSSVSQSCPTPCDPMNRSMPPHVMGLFNMETHFLPFWQKLLHYYFDNFSLPFSLSATWNSYESDF